MLISMCVRIGGVYRYMYKSISKVHNLAPTKKLLYTRIRKYGYLTSPLSLSHSNLTIGKYLELRGGLICS